MEERQNLEPQRARRTLRKVRLLRTDLRVAGPISIWRAGNLEGWDRNQER